MIQHTLADGVFEGGGVKGIGLIGALEEVERAGYEFANLAGTSAGAIVATLVAAGYSAAELKLILMDLDFARFTDHTWEYHLPVVGAALDEIVYGGIFKGDYFEGLLRDLLRSKGKVVFGDLLLDKKRFPTDADDPKYRFRARVVAADITRGRLLVLPDDLTEYGLVPEEFDIARAVRMSMSIPFFFRPIRLPYVHPNTGQHEDCTVVDGGLLSNFPVELFDTDGIPEWPTFGFKLVRGGDAALESVVRHPIHGPLSQLAAMFFTAMEAHDAYYLKAAKFARTIAIDTLDLASTDFTLTSEQKAALYNSGREAARNFLAHWDFDTYKALYRSGQRVPTRREQVLSRRT